MAQYRKLPVVIDAVLYDGNLVGEPSAADPTKVEPGTCPDWFPALSPVVGASQAELDAMPLRSWFSIVDQKGLFLKTLEGVMEASPGDWIIRGVKGELYPCKPDIFRVTYKVLSTTIMWGNLHAPRAVDKKHTRPNIGPVLFTTREEAVADDHQHNGKALATVPVEVPDDLVHGVA